MKRELCVVLDSPGLLMGTASRDAVCLGGIVSSLALGKHANEDKIVLQRVSTSILVATQAVRGKFKAVFSLFPRSSGIRRLLP